jgi:hypothetical protein
LRVLYVAPDTGNSNITDRQQRLLTDISSTGLNVTAVLGKVSVSQIVQQLRGGQYDILFLVAHGYPNGILLTQTAPNLPNEELTPAHLSSVARYGLKLVVLLACDSVTVGNMVVTSAQVDTICTVTQLDSETAYLTGSLLAQGLADGLSTRDAFEKARPGNDVDYVYLAARHIELDSKLTGYDGNQSAKIEEHGRLLTEHGRKISEHDEILRNQDKVLIVLKDRGILKVPVEAVFGAVVFVFLIVLFAMLARGGW